jgi:hypothetical protein
MRSIGGSPARCSVPETMRGRLFWRSRSLKKSAGNNNGCQNSVNLAQCVLEDGALLHSPVRVPPERDDAGIVRALCEVAPKSVYPFFVDR